MKNLSVIILAAGKGTRMNSSKPKVLHELAGKPMIKHVLDTTKKLSPKKINLVYGFGAEMLKQALQEEDINWVYQEQQLGTGHAVQQVLPFLNDDESVLIVYGDCPLITSETLQKLIDLKSNHEDIALLTVNLDNPQGYGRIIRDKNDKIISIVEQKDANSEQLQIKEINTGVMIVDAKDLKQWLGLLKNNNAQQEYYLTDIIAIANQQNRVIKSSLANDFKEVEGVNNLLQLSQQERYYQQKQATNLLNKGVKLIDPSRFDLRGELTCGKDVCIDNNVIIEGKVSVGNNVTIGAGCIIKDSIIEDNVEIKPYSIIENAKIGIKSIIGPFARLRPGTELIENARVGNFVEIKKATIGKNSKVNHLSYIGDSSIGKDCNIGAGVITCNYDGVNKFKTTIGNNVFVGSDVQLIAPVNIADRVTIGAGSTITEDAFEDELVLSRIPQKHIKNWKKKN